MARKKKDQDKVNKIVNDFKTSWDYCASYWHDKWQDWYRLYNSERVDVAYNGVSDTFVPMAYSTVETLVAGTSGDKPVVEYKPTRYDQNEETYVLNSLYSYYWDLDNWTNKLTLHNRNYFLLGSAVSYMYWDIDHPVMQNIAPRDFFIDPSVTAINYQEAAYMGHRFLSSVESLKSEQMIDYETGELVPKYKNLDKIEGDMGGEDQTEKQEQDRLVGTTLSGKAAQGQVEVLCYWTLDKVTYVANRQVVIYEDENFFKQRQQFLGFQNPTGMYPYLFDALSATESQLYGRSVIQPIEKPQELLNDLTNQNVDAASWSLDPIMELDPLYQSHMDKIKNVPGAVYPFKPGSLSAVQKPMIPAAVFNERTNIKNEIREATAIDQVLRGVGATGETTATEIKAQVAAANKRYELVIAEMEGGTYYRMAKMVFQMIRHYVTAPMMVRVIGQTGVDWQKFDPEMFNGDYEPRVKLKATVEADKQRTMRNVKEMYSALLGSPYVKQDQLTRLVVERAFDLSPEEADLLVNSQQDAMQSLDGAGSEEPNVLINYKDAPPDIKAQMEEEAGYQASPVHEGEIDRLAAEDVQSVLGVGANIPQKEGMTGGPLV